MYAKEFYGFLILEFSVFLELEVLRNSKMTGNNFTCHKQIHLRDQIQGHHYHSV